MKAKITFKTPDANYHALSGIDDEGERDKMIELINKFVKYGEICTIEFDTEANTATVVPV